MKKTVNKEITFIVLRKNLRSMHSSERIEEMICEKSGRHITNTFPQEDTTTNTALEYAEQEVEVKNCKRYIPIVGGVLSAELGP